MWNSLPTELRTATVCLDTFGKQLKICLFESPYWECIKPCLHNWRVAKNGECRRIRRLLFGDYSRQGVQGFRRHQIVYLPLYKCTYWLTDWCALVSCSLPCDVLTCFNFILICDQISLNGTSLFFYSAKWQTNIIAPAAVFCYFICSGDGRLGVCHGTQQWSY